jgi:hypothetical protein
VAGWQQLFALGQVPRRDMRREVAALKEDIDRLQQQVQPRHPDDEPA